nr:transposase [Oceanospirillum maris]
MSVVEPVFGNISTNKRLNRFSLRSKTKVQGKTGTPIFDPTKIRYLIYI